MIQEFFNTPLGLAVYGVLVATGADFFFGVVAARRDGTFSLDSVAAVLRKHIEGRVAPIFGMLFFGHFGNQPLLLAAGLAGASLYVAETVGSILNSWGPKKEIQPVPED